MADRARGGKVISAQAPSELPIGGFTPSYVFRRAVVGAVERTDVGYKFFANGDFPELAPLASQRFPNLEDMDAAIEGALPPGRLQNLLSKEEVWASEDRMMRHYFDRQFARFTWTGELFDACRPLEELAAILEQKIATAVANEKLPGPGTDYKVTVWAPPQRALGRPYRKLIIWSHRVAIEKGFRERLQAFGLDAMRPYNKSSAVQDDEWANPRQKLAVQVEAFMPTVMTAQERKTLEQQGWTRSRIEQERLSRYLAALGLLDLMKSS